MNKPIEIKPVRLHSKLSASGSHRWLACPGSVSFKDEIESTNLAAEIGKACHEIAENALVLNITADSFINMTTENGIVVTDEMVRVANKYIDYFWSYYKLNNVVGFEERVSFAKYVPEIDGGFGTLDAYILDPESKTCHVMDLKAGRVKVEVEDNSQLKLYALGLINKLKLKKDTTFTLHVVQPVINNCNSWEISYKDLIKFGKYVKERALLALSDNPPRSAGDQCDYCPKNPDCKVLFDHVASLLDDVETDTYTLEKDKLEKIYLNKKLIEKFIEQVELKIKNDLLLGVKYENLKIVESKKNRIYNDKAEEILCEILGDKTYQPKKLITITDAEKLVDQNVINEITYRPEGSPIVVDKKDKRISIEYDNMLDKI